MLTKYTLSFLGVIFAIVLIGVSMAMNWRFGFSLGKTELDGQIYGAASVAADGLKVLAPFFMAWAAYNNHYKFRYAAIAILIVCGSYSFVSSLGFSSSNRITTKGQQEITQTLNQSAISQLKSDQQELAKVRKTLKQRLTRNVRLRLLDKEKILLSNIAQSRKDLGFSLVTISREAPGKAQQEFLGNLTSFSQEYILIFLILLVSALVEFGSSLGLYLSLGHARNLVKEQDPKEKTKQEIPQEPAQEILQDLANPNLINLEDHKDKTVALNRRINPGLYTFDDVKKFFEPAVIENNWKPNNLANKLKGLGWEKTQAGEWEKPALAA